MSSPLKPPATTNRDRAFSGWLDLFRALAAFAVLFGHARSLFLSSADTGAGPDPVSRVLYFASGYGHLAVMVFFVLSGYLVGGTAVRAVREGRWSWGKYLLQRSTRLYAVLIPALILTLAWDAAEQQQVIGLTPNTDTAVANISSERIREHTGGLIFLGNVVFTQTVLVPPLGSNTPLWSLTYEFWYYLIFPMLWLAVAAPGIRRWVRGGYLLGAGAALAFLGPQIALYFLIWLLGVGVALLPEVGSLRRPVVRGAAVAAAGGLVAALLVVVRTKFAQGWSELAQDAAVAVAFGLLLYGLKHNTGPVRLIRLRRAVAGFADFSYTLYLVHLPLLIFLRACLTYEVAWAPSAVAWAKLFAIVCGVTVYAYLVSLATERQTDKLRRWIESRLTWTAARPDVAPRGEPAPAS
ncbi:MAG: acyltransferase [Gemmataceae bacterium]|nr:acyltransferase [Gemmataceae bacterium]